MIIPDWKRVGQRLKKLREDANYKLLEVADNLGYDASLVNMYETGQRNVPSEYIMNLFTLINRSPEEFTQFIREEHLELPKPGSGLNGKFPILGILPSVSFATAASAQAIKEQVKEGQGSLASIETALTELSKSVTQQSQQQFQTLTNEVKSLKQNFIEVQVSSQKLMAPVSIPALSDMEVKLVPSNSLERLQEYKDEETFWFTFFGIFLGGIIGVFTNVGTGGQMNPTAWLILGLFLICAGIFFWAAWRKRRLAEVIKRRIFSNPQANEVKTPLADN